MLSRYLKKMIKILLILAFCFNFLPNARGEAHEHKRESDWIVAFTATNTLSKPVRVSEWGTPFEDFLTTHCITVTFNGEELDYYGVMAYRPPPPPLSDYIVFNPGEPKL